MKISPIAALMLSMAGAGAAEVNLIDAGKSPYVIVTPARPAPPEEFAAAELQRYLQRMTGVRLPVVPETRWKGEPCLCVGRTGSALKSGRIPKPRYEDDDAFDVSVQARNVYIAGTNPRGTLSGAYRLLTALGCRWFAPGYEFYREFNEVIPKPQRVAVDAGLHISVQPAFKLRGEYPEHSFVFGPDDIVALLDWCAKNQINLIGFRQNELSEAWYRVIEPEARRRGLNIASEGHGYARFLPRDRYFREHPEWFAMLNGQRSDRYFDQFCTSNPQAIAEFRKNLTEYVRAFPALSRISTMPNDSPHWCECDRCKAEKLTPRDRLFRMNELIAKTVYEANPKIKVEFHVGIEYFGVAANEFFAATVPNATYRTGVLRRCLRHAWNDPECEANHLQYPDAAGITGKVLAQGSDVIWTSRYGSFREQSLPGILYPHQMAAELQDLKKLGGSGVLYNYATPAEWIPYELKQYMYARLMVNPNEPIEPLLATYFKERFSGSPEDVAAFYTALRRAMERYDHPGGGYTRENHYGLYPSDQLDRGASDFAEAKAAIERAEKSNPKADERQLLWLLKASLEYGQARFEIDRLSQTGKREEAQALALKLMDHVEAWDGRGIFYDSMFLRRGIEERFGGRSRTEPRKKSPTSGTRVHEYKQDDADPAPREVDGPPQDGRRRRN